MKEIIQEITSKAGNVQLLLHFPEESETAADSVLLQKQIHRLLLPELLDQFRKASEKGADDL